MLPNQFYRTPDGLLIKHMIDARLGEPTTLGLMELNIVLQHPDNPNSAYIHWNVLNSVFISPLWISIPLEDVIAEVCVQYLELLSQRNQELLDADPDSTIEEPDRKSLISTFARLVVELL